MAGVAGFGTRIWSFANLRKTSPNHCKQRAFFVSRNSRVMRFCEGRRRFFVSQLSLKPRMRIPMNSDTCSNPIRTVVGAKFCPETYRVSEMSQTFPLTEGPFSEPERRQSSGFAISQKRVVLAIPQCGSDATGRSVASPRLAACSVAHGPFGGGPDDGRIRHNKTVSRRTRPPAFTVSSCCLEN